MPEPPVQRMSRSSGAQPSGFSQWTDSLVRSALQANIRFQEIALVPRVMLQTQTIPADRNLDSPLDASLALAITLQRFISTACGLRRVIVVDDWHTGNSIQYPAFYQTLRNLSYRPHHMLFYSSPLLQELAVDILKYFLRPNGNCRRFRATAAGDRVFLELTDKRASIELSRRFSAEDLVDGLLLEAAMSIFQRHCRMLIQLYAALHHLPERTDIHRSMFDYYTLTDIPRRVRTHFHEPHFLRRRSFEEVLDTLDDMPYLSALRAPGNPPSPRTVLLNVLECVHRPHQAKLNQILELLGEEPAYSVYFDASGRIEVETSRFEGARTEVRERIQDPGPHGEFLFRNL